MLTARCRATSKPRDYITPFCCCCPLSSKKRSVSVAVREHIFVSEAFPIINQKLSSPRSATVHKDTLLATHTFLAKWRIEDEEEARTNEPSVVIVHCLGIMFIKPPNCNLAVRPTRTNAYSLLPRVTTLRQRLNIGSITHTRIILHLCQDFY